jgi:hypothetical protein
MNLTELKFRTCWRPIQSNDELPIQLIGSSQPASQPASQRYRFYCSGRYNNNNNNNNNNGQYQGTYDIKELQKTAIILGTAHTLREALM